MDFEWDDAKGEANLEKHGVDFKDGARVFLDRHRIERLDTQHYYAEDRYQTIGMVDGRVLFVVYTERGTTVRLISARRAIRRERTAYEDALGSGQPEDGKD